MWGALPTKISTVTFSILAGFLLLIVILCIFYSLRVYHRWIHQTPAFSNEEIDSHSAEYHLFKIHDVEQQLAKASFSYTPSDRLDEIELLKDDIVQMYYYFDDGWAFGDNFFSGKRGLFPLSFVARLSPEETREWIGDFEEENEIKKEHKVCL